MSERQQGPDVESVSPDDLELTGEFQVMDDLDDDTYQSLKVSIETDGFDESTPIVVDEENVVLDGHHRLQASQEAGIEEVPIVRKTGLSGTEKRQVAYEHNMRRRNLAAGERRGIVKNYLQEEFDPDTQTQTDVANTLGVSASTVSRARREIEEEDGVDIFQVKSDQRSNAEKRADVEDYLGENPDASNRSVAGAVGVSKTTVKKVRDTLSDDENDKDSGADSSSPSAAATATDDKDSSSRNSDSSSSSTRSTSSGQESGTPTNSDAQATALEGGPKAEDLSTDDFLGSDPAEILDNNGDADTETVGKSGGAGGPETDPIRFADTPARDRLEEQGTVAIFRTGIVPTGLATHVSMPDDEPVRKVIVGECETIDPQTGLEPYVDLSGFESVEEWLNSMGDIPDSGTLYLVVETGDE